MIPITVNRVVAKYSGKHTGETILVDQHGQGWTSETDHQDYTGKRSAKSDGRTIEE